MSVLVVKNSTYYLKKTIKVILFIHLLQDRIKNNIKI